MSSFAELQAVARQETGTFPKRIRIEQSTHDGKDSYWRTLCIVYDNESLGILERLLPVPIKVENACSWN